MDLSVECAIDEDRAVSGRDLCRLETRKEGGWEGKTQGYQPNGDQQNNDALRFVFCSRVRLYCFYDGNIAIVA